MKFRNKFIAKRIGTKTLASLLAFGMALGSPMAAFADDGETVVVAENTVQAKKTDGSEAFVSVSDCVRGMMESGAVRLNNETGYLEDTSTGQKVDPETGERLTETPDVPETPAIPDTPGNQENPESPGTPENPENPKVPEKPDTPGTPETPEKPETPTTPKEGKKKILPSTGEVVAYGLTILGALLAVFALALLLRGKRKEKKYQQGQDCRDLRTGNQRALSLCRSQ